MSNIFDKYFEKKHTIHAHKCRVCGKGLSRNNFSGKTMVCKPCYDDKDKLPEEFFCKAISKSTKKRCKQVAIDTDYCTFHKKQGESNGEN